MKTSNHPHSVVTHFIAVLVLLAALGTFPASAQEAAPSCPAVNVSCPDSVQAGEELTFTAGVSGGDDNVQPTYNWSVSAGTISSGQGTSTIVVDTAGTGGQTITATADVGGFSRECPSSQSCTTSVTEKSAPATKAGEYVARDLKANTAILDNFILQLMNDPAAQGYIIAYGGRTSRPEDAQKAADNATEYTMNVRKIDGARTLAGVGGYREADHRALDRTRRRRSPDGDTDSGSSGRKAGASEGVDDRPAGSQIREHVTQNLHRSGRLRYHPLLQRSSQGGNR